MKKFYILDTNVLIHDPMSFSKFEDNTVVIPISVIEELDTFKSVADERGKAARIVSRKLDELRRLGKLDAGVKMENVLGVIEGEEYFDVSKKIAQLKAMRRVRFEKVGDQIVATSMVTSFEAAAARALLVAGADVVFIAADRKGELRISSRAKPHILALGVHLGHFMEEIGRETGNQGGGHDGAAGLNGTGNGEKVLSICMDRMAILLSGKLGVPRDTRRNGRRGGRGKGRGARTRQGIPINNEGPGRKEDEHGTRE